MTENEYLVITRFHSLDLKINIYIFYSLDLYIFYSSELQPVQRPTSFLIVIEKVPELLRKDQVQYLIRYV